MSKPVRVSILGAGPAGLATALELTHPKRKGKYEVTIYQSGWRAGGLCAGGRVPPEWWVDQNCTHYLFGCYEQSLYNLRTCLEELAGDPRFGTFEQHLVGRSMVVMSHIFKGERTRWPMNFDRFSQEVGKEPAPSGPIHLFQLALKRMVEYLRSDEILKLVESFDSHLNFIEKATIAGANEVVELAAIAVLNELNQTYIVTASEPAITDQLALAVLVGALRKAVRLLLEPFACNHVEADRLLMVLDLGLTILLGLLKDDAVRRNMALKLDHWELRDWLHHHEALKSTLEGPLLALWYDSMAAYVNGDARYPRVATGPSLLCLIQIVLNYPDFIAYQLRWEVADTVIAPQVAALQKRGVRFAFFHRAWELIPGEGGVEKVILEQQAQLSGGPFSYQPFITPTDGHALWPNEPLMSQIKTVYAKDHVAVLDRFYCPREGPNVVLEQGKDYDVLVCALPGPTLKWYTSKVASRSHTWKKLLEGLKGVESQGLRLWFKEDLAEGGWEYGPPITSALPLPYGTWEDPTPVLGSQSWPSPAPVCIAHLFGPLSFNPDWPGPTEVTKGWAYLRAQQDRAQWEGTDWLQDAAGLLWPNFCFPGTNSLDPTTCVRPAAIPPKDGPGQIRANSGPDQAYLWMYPGNLKDRPTSNHWILPGFYAVGDWAHTNFPCGSVEAASLSARDAGEAIDRDYGTEA